MQKDFEKLYMNNPGYFTGLIIHISNKQFVDVRKFICICYNAINDWLTTVILPKDVIKSIQKAKFPKLKKLLLFIGVDDYGFDGDADTIKELLEQADFPELTYLGITNSEIQDELTEVVLNSKFMGQISVLDLSNGTISDKGGALILEKISDYPNINKLRQSPTDNCQRF